MKKVIDFRARGACGELHEGPVSWRWQCQALVLTAPEPIQTLFPLCRNPVTAYRALSQGARGFAYQLVRDLQYPDRTSSPPSGGLWPLGLAPFVLWPFVMYAFAMAHHKDRHDGVYVSIIGGVVLNAPKEELPEERQSSILPFALGGAAYAALFVVAD